VDNIDVVSGKLHFKLPLASLPRSRGGMRFDLDLQYDSNLYDIYPQTHTYYVGFYQQMMTWTTNTLFSITASGGWTYSPYYGLEMELDETECPQYFGRGRVRMRVMLPDRSMHILFLKGWEGDPSSQGFCPITPEGKDNSCYMEYNPPPQILNGLLTYYTADGSFLKVEIHAGDHLGERSGDGVLRL